MTCCFFSSLKTLLTCGGYRPHAQINVLAPLYMAGFQVIIYGRVWVFTEGIEIGATQERSRGEEVAGRFARARITDPPETLMLCFQPLVECRWAKRGDVGQVLSSGLTGGSSRAFHSIA